MAGVVQVEAETGDPAHRRPRGLAVASFADVDKTGKVRNALKFKCPTKQVRHRRECVTLYSSVKHIRRCISRDLHSSCI